MRVSLTLLAALSLFVLAIALPSPARVLEAGTAVRMDLPDLVAGAELVLEGQVISEHAVEDGHGRIETEYLLSVSRTWLGAHEPLRSVRLPGGQLPDGRGLLLAGMPRLSAGERVLLFLTEAGPNGMRMPVGLGQGRLRVVETQDGAKLLTRDTGELQLLDPATGRTRPADGTAILDYPAFTSALASALAERRAAEAAGRVYGGR